MEQEYLKMLKEKISSLTDEEKKLRNEYLRNLSVGSIQGPSVGYSDIDKPWLKCYSEDALKKLNDFDVKDESMYQTLQKYAVNHPYQIAFEYLGKEYTYLDVMTETDKVADALNAKGIGKKEIIPIILPNMPEARYLIYACSKIGAIPNPIMPTISDNDLNTIIDNTGCKHLFLMDGLLKEKKNIINSHKIKDENVIEISPLRSSGGLFSILYNLTMKKNNKKYDNFLSEGIGQNTKIASVTSDDIALIEQTGGTTALTTKSVMITNGNVLASNYQLEHGEFNFDEGDSLLDILIPSISYGAAFEHLTLCNGIKNYMIPILVKEQISKYISKYKPNHIMMGPIHFECICKDKKNRDWNYIKNIVSGGDSMTLTLESDSNAKLKNNSVSVELEQGYGESECFGAAACNHADFIKNGSVGIPHLLTNIAVFEYNDCLEDYTTDNELSYENKGELCISSPVVMQGYLNNIQSTDQVLKRHSDGTIWLHTGDIGYMDSNGYVYITDRIKDLIFRNGFKVSPQKINKMIQEIFGDKLESSIVVGIPDEIERNVPIVFYKLKEEFINESNEFENILKDMLDKNLSEIEMPKDIVKLDIIPRTSAGKVDKKLVKKNYIDSLSSKQK